MGIYDYYDAVKADLFEYLKEIADYESFYYPDIDHIWDDSSLYNRITGNIDGSYYCNTYLAEEALCHNWNLLFEVIEEYDLRNEDVIKRGAEYCDVLVRDYVLGQILSEYDSIEELYEDAGISYNS